MKFDLRVIRRKKIYLGISAIMVLMSLSFLLFIPLNLGIDFKGGELLQLQFEKTLNRDTLNNNLNNLQSEIPQLKNKRLQYSEDNTIVLRTEQLEDNQREVLTNTLTEKVGKYEIVKNDKVGPTIGKELTEKSILALVIGSILIIIYVTIRFELVYAVVGLLALLHDIIITMGLIALLKYEINTPFIASILTILGYSINDTIVIFDRIRENEKKEGKVRDYSTIIEESVDQVFVRSVNTSLTTIMAIVVLLIFGGDTLKTFSMTLFIGMIIGSYSSIFMATPLVYIFRKYRKPKNKSTYRLTRTGVFTTMRVPPEGSARAAIEPPVYSIISRLRNRLKPRPS